MRQRNKGRTQKKREGRNGFRSSIFSSDLRMGPCTAISLAASIAYLTVLARFHIIVQVRGVLPKLMKMNMISQGIKSERAGGTEERRGKCAENTLRCRVRVLCVESQVELLQRYGVSNSISTTTCRHDNTAALSLQAYT